MTYLFRSLLILAGLILVLGFFNMQRAALNAVVAEGQTVLLPLRPVDPRALMQGDYMALAYAESVYPQTVPSDAPSGYAVLRLDAHNTGSFQAIADSPEPQNADEVALSYTRLFGGDVSYGGTRYYFQEGTAETYEAAAYGVFKVSPSGRAVLTGLADEEFNVLSAASVPRD